MINLAISVVVSLTNYGGDFLKPVYPNGISYFCWYTTPQPLIIPQITEGPGMRHINVLWQLIRRLISGEADLPWYKFI